MVSTIIQGFGAQALTILVLLGFCSSCPIGQGCMTPTYDELANGKADRDLTYNITAEVNINRFHKVFRPNAVKALLINPPIFPDNVQANGNCPGYQTFGNINFSDSYLQSAMCSWRYECDYDPHRIPATLFFAKCISSTVTVEDHTHNCREVYHPIATIHTSSCDPLRNNTQEWEMERLMNIPVACVTVS